MGVMPLLDQLTTWSADDLAHLLQTRPDLLSASDRGLEGVARKAGTPVSLGRALVSADVGMLVVAEALVVRAPATVADLDERLGTNDPIAVAEAVERCRRRAVVTVEDGTVFPVGALADLLHRPLGLGPSFVDLADNIPTDAYDHLVSVLRADGTTHRSATTRAVAHRLSDPGTLDLLLADAPADARALLDELIAHRSPAVTLPTGFPYRQLDRDDPLAWLLNAGLVAAVTENGAELPRELVLAGHPDGLAPGAALRPIELGPVDGLADDVVTGDAADRANQVLDGAEMILRMVGQGEVSIRKAGGVGPRELKRVAKRCGLDVVSAARLFELLALTRLITTMDGRLLVSDLAGRWWGMHRHRRYLALIRAWLAADRFLSRGLIDGDGSTAVALGDAEPLAAAAAGRTVAMNTICTLPPGAAFDPQQVAAAVVWQGPNLWGTGEPPAEDLMTCTIDEAELLGLVAGNAPSPVLRALMGDDEPALTDAATATLADDQDRFVLQSDLTAVSFGPLAPAVGRSLAQMADRIDGSGETRTSGYRFTEAGIRRALDRGWTPESIEAFLTEHALSGIPQPLTYLITDVARRYGTIRVQPAQSVIITADDVAAVDLGANRKASGLGLRLIAPTVLTSPLDPVTVVEALRELGLFPVLEGSSVVLDQPADAGRVAVALEELPADWVGPALGDGPLPDEIGDAVAALLAAPENLGLTSRPVSERPDGETDTIDRRLQAFWRRAAAIDAVVDGAAQTITGVVVAIGPTVALLTTTGVIEVPAGSLLDVTDPTAG